MSVITYSLQDIKKEFAYLAPEQISALCLRLARYKKENKELLAYLLFEAHDEQAFVEKVKADVAEMFCQLPPQNYHAAKGLRKILRLINKYNKFMGSKTAEIDLLISFCHNYLQHADKRTNYKPLRLILVRQLEKIRSLVEKLNDDLQFDYTQEYNQLHIEAEKRLSWLYR